ELHRLFSAPLMQQYRLTHEAELTPTESEIATATAWFQKKRRGRIEEQDLRTRLEAVEEELSGTQLTAEQREDLEIQRRKLQSSLRPLDRSFAEWYVGQWKVQRHLYDEYGGGRVIWQQAGLEAFDAMHRWLRSEERDGRFQISDPKLRSMFYDYWTRGPSFVIEDEKR